MEHLDAPPQPELLASARRGDPAAFERLVDSYRRELYAHCYRMLGSVQDAEDALQESLLGAWRGIAGFEGRSSLRAWLYRVTTNACLRLIARRPQRMRSMDHGPAWRDTDDRRELVDAFVAAWERADVPALLELLAEDARFTMPPLPAWFLGREDIARFFNERMFATPWRLAPVRRMGSWPSPATRGRRAATASGSARSTC